MAGQESVEANNIRVAIRCRPFSARELTEGSATPALEIHPGATVLVLPVQEARASKSFTYDHVFGFADTQEALFQAAGVQLLENALNAYNGCIFAYGQTGSGKSHSMVGDVHSEAEKGLLPRACLQLFSMLDTARAADARFEATVLASYLEIYNEKVFDLLSGSDRGELQIRSHPQLGAIVGNLTECPVECFAEAHELLDFGATRRAVGATQMNAASSRSHAVFTIQVRMLIACSAGGSVESQAKIHFVDLAGSERQKKSGAVGDRLKEGIGINLSLTTLGRVIADLTKPGTRSVPPFRDSKLTLLLKDALMGNSRTCLLACISPSVFNLDETISTLEFASRCKLVKTNATKNEQSKLDVIDKLTSEKAVIEALLHEEKAKSENRLAELQRQEKHYQEAVRKEQELRLQLESDYKVQQEKELEMTSQLEALRGVQESFTLNQAQINAKREHLQRQREAELSKLGMNFDGLDLVDVHTAPKLVNLHPDPALKGCLVYYLPVGETRIGSDAGRCRVTLIGLNIDAEVCIIDNTDNADLSVKPIGGGVVRVNGCMVNEAAGCLLRDGDRLAIGRAYIFRVQVPNGKRPSVVGSDVLREDFDDFEKAMEEISACTEVDPQWENGIQKAMLLVMSDFGSEAAGKLLSQARRASEACEMANGVLRQMPAEKTGVSKFELSIMFNANGLPDVCVVARRFLPTSASPVIAETGASSAADKAASDPSYSPPVVFDDREESGQEETGTALSAGIWEVEKFWKERLPAMYDAFSTSSFALLEPDQADPGRNLNLRHWESRVWSEVSLADFRSLLAENDQLKQSLHTAQEAASAAAVPRKSSRGRAAWEASPLGKLSRAVSPASLLRSSSATRLTALPTGRQAQFISTPPRHPDFAPPQRSDGQQIGLEPCERDRKF